jgi:hypothetical protein
MKAERIKRNQNSDESSTKVLRFSPSLKPAAQGINYNSLLYSAGAPPIRLSANPSMPRSLEVKPPDRPPESPPSPPATPPPGRRDSIFRKADDSASRTLGPIGSEGFAAPSSSLADVLQASGSNPLETGTRAFMESRFGYDFGHIRVHTDERAARSAQDFGALAYTVGNHIVFGAGQYKPTTSSGRRLVAHELAHVVQQGGETATETGQAVQRYPETGGADEIHDPLIEQYRRAHAQGPGGRDPRTGEQVGPTDAELKYGGELDRWLRQGTAPALVAAPLRVPGLAQVAGPFNTAACGVVTGGMPAQQAEPIRACIVHSRFVNHMNQSTANMRQVSSPYAAGLAALYTALLQQLISAGQMSTPTPTAPRRYTLTNLTIAVSASTSLPVPGFVLVLEQNINGGGNGAWDGQALTLNEMSGAAVTDDQADIERTMYHEGFHFLSDLVSGANRTARTASPNAPIVERELDASLVMPFQRRFEAAVLPFWTEALTTRSVVLPSRIPVVAAAYAGIQWVKVANEILSRIEETVYLNLRMGQGFAEADLRALPQRWILTAGYWPSLDIPQGSMQAYLTSKTADLNAQVLPLVQEIQRAYLSLRPGR